MPVIKHEGKPVPILYVFLYKIIKERSNGFFVNYKQLKEIFRRRLYKIPQNYFLMFVDEMCEMKLLRKIGNRPHQKYELTGKDVLKALNKASFPA